MKNVLFFLVMFSSLALTDVSAQANCKPANCAPCPPGCCILNCCLTGSAAATKEKTGEVSFVSFSEEDMQKANACQMTKKERKACIAACKSNAAANAACLPVPSCNSAPAGHNQSAQLSSNAGIEKVSLPEKS